MCLYRPLSRGGIHPILSFRGLVAELFSGGWWRGDEVGRHLVPRGACSTTLSVSTHGLECGRLRTGCKGMMSLDWSHSTSAQILSDSLEGYRHRGLKKEKRVQHSAVWTKSVCLTQKPFQDHIHRIINIPDAFRICFNLSNLKCFCDRLRGVNDYLK